ncbi:MAG: class II fructose-bisphosphate aldolase [Candidatus Enteromonas sp.]|nr:class II fructose-bisphosphate aldolase [Candidatus Enteromonas sp.]
MLATLNEVLAYANEHNLAIGAFNTPTLETLDAVIDAAEELNLPVIISHAEIHEPQAPLHKIGPVMVLRAKNAKVPVCVHLDHGEHIDYIVRAMELGFTSVMYDGSLLPTEVNIAFTKRVVELAHAKGVSVEAEIGALPSREGGAGNGASDPTALYTDPELAKRFVTETGIDALAASFGTAHGIYKAKPKLDFPRIEKIVALTGIPLVMHGGSGVPPEDYLTAISCGVRKINYYSYMAREGVYGAKSFIEKENPTFYHEVAFAAYESMKKDAKKAMIHFSNGYVKE